MTAPFSDELLSAYLDGELNAEEQAYVEVQLRERVELRRLCDELRALRATLRAMPVSRPPENFAERVMRQAERQMLTGSPTTTDLTSGDSEPAAGLSVSRFLASRRWRIGLGVVAGLAACALAMVFLMPPFLSTTERVASAPEPTMGDAETTAELAQDRGDVAKVAKLSELNEKYVMRGRNQAFGAAGAAGAPPKTDPTGEIEMLPSAAEESRPAAPVVADESTAVGTSVERHPKREQEGVVGGRRDESSSGEPAMSSGSGFGSAAPPSIRRGGIRGMGGGGSIRPVGPGMSGGFGGGMGGMGGGAGGVPRSLEPKSGQLTDMPAYAPAATPPADMAVDVKTKSVEGLEPSEIAATDAMSKTLPSDAQAEMAWLGTRLTAESIEQCTAQLDQSHFLLVRVSGPEAVDLIAGVPHSTMGKTLAADALKLFAETGVAVKEEGKLRNAAEMPEQKPGGGGRAVGQATQENPVTPPQVLIVEGSADRIRDSLAQLAARPEISVELASIIDSQTDRRLRILRFEDDLPQERVADNYGEGQSKNSEDGISVPREHSGRPMQADGRVREAKDDSVAKAPAQVAGKPADKADPARDPSREKLKGTAQDAVALPAPPAQPQDPAAVSKSAPAIPAAPAVPSVDKAPSAGTAAMVESANRPNGASVPSEVAKERAVIYILYRLLPEPAVPGPAGESGDR